MSKHRLPDESLSESIKRHGVVTPLVVRRLSLDRYHLVDGVARLSCIKEKVETVKCIIMGEEGIHDVPVRKIILPKR